MIRLIGLNLTFIFFAQTVIIRVARRQIPSVLSEIGCPPMPNKDSGSFGPKTLQIVPTVVVHWFVSFLIVLIAFDH